MTQDQCKYDSNGNLIYHYIKYTDGYEVWYEYDSNGRRIRFKNSTGKEVWYEYDSNGNCIHTKHANGWKEWREYDNNGYCIHYKDSSGHEQFWASPCGICGATRDNCYC